MPQLNAIAGWRAPYVFALAVGAVALVLVATSGRQSARAARPASFDAHAKTSMFTDGRLYRLAAMHGIGLLTLGNLAVVTGTPLLGLAFSLPGNGRIGFAAVAGVWLLGLLMLPRDDELGVRRPVVVEAARSH